MPHEFGERENLNWWALAMSREAWADLAYKFVETFKPHDQPQIWQNSMDSWEAEVVFQDQKIIGIAS